MAIRSKIPLTNSEMAKVQSLVAFLVDEDAEAWGEKNRLRFALGEYRYERKT